jgi:LmbE family N-acetylglucosaminyl deacetylase
VNATFDHRVTGTRAAAWQGAGLDSLPSVAASAGPLLVLVAHPDDESLGAGGLLAASGRLGAPITVVIATDGENSHPDSPTHRPGELAVIRRDEATAAVTRVAPHATIGHLGLPDGALSSYADTLDVALRAFLEPLGNAAGDPVRFVTPWRGDGHPDHEACALAVTRLAREREIEHWEFPIWAWHWGDPAGDDLPWPRLRRLELSTADLTAKRQALAEHVSQHRPLSEHPGDEPVLSTTMLEHFDRAYEYFLVPAPATRRDYFDALYAETADPWGLGERFYEQRKRAVLLATLPRRRFRRAFEPGCATGLLTQLLAPVCDELIAWDISEAAVEQTARRFAATAATAPLVERGRIPADWPEGTFDLIVLSEVGYYCDDLDLLCERVLGSLSDDGVVVGCHWRHAAVDHPQRAEDVHQALDRVLHRDVHHLERDFRLDVWSRSAISVAEADGIL